MEIEQIEKWMNTSAYAGKITGLIIGHIKYDEEIPIKRKISLINSLIRITEEYQMMDFLKDELADLSQIFSKQIQTETLNHSETLNSHDNEKGEVR
jgi:hypothetical protein